MSPAGRRQGRRETQQKGHWRDLKSQRKSTYPLVGSMGGAEVLETAGKHQNK